MPVKVATHPVTGNVITPSENNPEWGTVRVDSENISFSNGMMNVSKRSAFIRGRVAHLELMKFRAGQTLKGKIQKQESFEPFYENQPPKINPTTQEVVLTNGRETYLQFQYVEDENALDLWIAETPVEQEETAQEALAEQAL